MLSSMKIVSATGLGGLWGLSRKNAIVEYLDYQILFSAIWTYASSKARLKCATYLALIVSEISAFIRTSSYSFRDLSVHPDRNSFQDLSVHPDRQTDRRTDGHG